jgi:hypothetical protein
MLSKEIIQMAKTYPVMAKQIEGIVYRRKDRVALRAALEAPQALPKPPQS